jgi:DNA-binding NarL/FixJ family response regulator
VIRVVIAEDHEDHGVVRVGLEQLLGTFPELEVLGSAANGAEAVELSRSLRPDVVLMDLQMPQVDGIEATRRILAEHPQTRIIVLTSFSDRSRILRALDAGAIGYLLKDAEPQDLRAAILAAHRGEAPLAPLAAHVVLTARTQSDPVDALSDREREVLVLVGRGLANKVIAQRLGISEKTVKAHLTSVYRAIGVTDRTQAALWAQRHGLLDQGH